MDEVNSGHLRNIQLDTYWSPPIGGDKPVVKDVQCLQHGRNGRVMHAVNENPQRIIGAVLCFMRHFPPELFEQATHSKSLHFVCLI